MQSPRSKLLAAWHALAGHPGDVVTEKYTRKLNDFTAEFEETRCTGCNAVKSVNLLGIVLEGAALTRAFAAHQQIQGRPVGDVTLTPAAQRQLHAEKVEEMRTLLKGKSNAVLQVLLKMPPNLVKELVEAENGDKKARRSAAKTVIDEGAAHILGWSQEEIDAARARGGHLGAQYWLQEARTDAEKAP